MNWTDKIKVTNEDNMTLMARYPDNYFDLAIVDPPYGIGMSGGNVGYKGKNNLKRKSWDDKIPDESYFKELARVSKNQIIWGGNYFIKYLRGTRCFLVWDKGEGFYNRTYAECELAWTSFDKNTKKVKRDPLAKGDYRGKIHPTQKPVLLYEWQLKNYTEPNQKILDTHLGSGSHAIAVHNMNAIEGMNLELTACELDEEYFKDSHERFKRVTSQRSLFE